MYNLKQAFFMFTLLIAVLSHALAAGKVQQDYSKPLPAWETQQEKALRILNGFPNPQKVDAPPSGTVQSYPEWAPASGVIISWMGFNDFLTDMVREFVQVGTSWIVVESAAQQNNVEARLTNAGISLDHVEFLTFDMDSVWMVDYGPFFIQHDGEREIIDNIYDRYGRWEDDAFPGRLGNSWDIPVYESDLRIEGGNFIADGNGVCFITDRVLEQNQGYLTEQEVYDRLRDYCGCETVHVLDRLNDGTGHIDMFAKLLDADTMLIGQYEPGDPEYSTLENNATEVAQLTASTGQPYEVVRIPMPGSPYDYWTYTNSLIVGDHVYVPIYNAPEDGTALSIYETAMPGTTVIGIDASSVIGSGGAVHCTTKVVPIGAEYGASIENVEIDDSTGDNDGLPDPGETITLIVTLKNSGLQSLTDISGLLRSDHPGEITIIDDEAAWPDMTPGTSSVSLAPHFQIHVSDSAAEHTIVTFFLDLTATNYTAQKTFQETITSMQCCLSWNLDADPGWNHQGDWAWGVPAGSGGSSGNPDPDAGFTGQNVLGYNLSGDYPDNMSQTSYLTTSALDCSQIHDTILKFRCWLGVETNSYDHAKLQISADGFQWTDLWANGSESMSGGTWELWSFDVSGIADGNTNFHIRWGMGPTDSSVHYCGWNIDDIEIWGIMDHPPGTPTPTPPTTPTPTEIPPTATQVPSHTPSPSPTIPLTATPTPSSTHPSTPTKIPSATQTPEPSPTQTPTEPLHVRLHLNKQVYHSGDAFILSCSIQNHGPEVDVLEFILLDVYGDYWFWPSWSNSVDSKQRNLFEDFNETDVILDFTWPETENSASDIRFWSALTDPVAFQLLSNVSMVSFDFE